MTQVGSPPHILVVPPACSQEFAFMSHRQGQHSARERVGRSADWKSSHGGRLEASLQRRRLGYERGGFGALKGRDREL